MTAAKKQTFSESWNRLTSRCNQKPLSASSSLLISALRRSRGQSSSSDVKTSANLYNLVCYTIEWRLNWWDSVEVKRLNLTKGCRFLHFNYFGLNANSYKWRRPLGTMYTDNSCFMKLKPPKAFNDNARFLAQPIVNYLIDPTQHLREFYTSMTIMWPLTYELFYCQDQAHSQRWGVRTLGPGSNKKRWPQWPHHLSLS